MSTGPGEQQPPKHGDYPALFWDLEPEEPIDLEHPAVLGRILSSGRLEMIQELVPFEMIERNLDRLEMPEHSRRFWGSVVEQRRKRREAEGLVDRRPTDP